jgi:preprotein translocase subunit SecD
MIYFEKWKIVLIVAVSLLGIVYAVPTMIPRGALEGVPTWFPQKQINLGLDLRGGVHLLIEVEVEVAIKERLSSIVNDVREKLRPTRVGYRNLGVEGYVVAFTVSSPEEASRAREAVRYFSREEIQLEGDGTRVALRLTEKALRDRRMAAVEQSLEIVRRRIDESGVKEATIVRQGVDRILVQVPGERDPERIKALIGKTAKMTFHLLDETATPEQAESGRAPPGSMVLESDHELDSRGRPVKYVVQQRVRVDGANLVDAQPTFQDSRPVVSFRFDSVGARRFAEITRQNVGRPFAIVLDRKVVSAPVIREPILAGNGIISGNFTVQSAGDLSIVLRAGALPAPLKFLEERTVGAELGADSIRAGEIACLVAYLLIAVLMVVGYGLFGVIANVGLILNLLFTISIMSLLGATLTLPGIAGMILGLAMSVDANVLVYERMREEQRNGRTAISTVDFAFRRAYVTIIDSNVTVFIAALILYTFGSGPVRGFAVTLTIGIACSMFTAVTMTRHLVVQWLAWRRPKLLPI